MKALVWGLNIVQFLVVYLFAFALFRYGIFELLPPETGLTARGVWPAASIGIAFLPWKFYNRFSNYLISFFKSTDIPKANISNMSKPWPSKLLYTFFFGYAALKWRRLIRTLILIPLVGGLISGIVAGAINFFTGNPTSGMLTNYEEDELLFESPNGNVITESEAKSRYGDRFQGLVDSGTLEQMIIEGVDDPGSWSDFVLVSFGWIGIFIGVSLVIALISWLIKPFIVKEE